MSELNWIDWLI